MGVYIKGMEMPKDRPQLLWVYPNGKALTVQSDVDPWKDLQAVPVPPHGDLIDRDALMDSDGDLWDGMWGYSGMEIMNAPTIIPAEDGE